MIGETDFTSGPSTLHEKAIYIVEGQLYQVERFDFDSRKAFVREVECDYYTDAITYTKVTILDTFAGGGVSPARDRRRTTWRRWRRASTQTTRIRHQAPRHVGAGQPSAQCPVPSACSHGEVHVVSRVVGFKKIKFYTNENVGSGELDLPEQQMHTTSYWLTIPRSVMAALPYGTADRRDGVLGLAYAMHNVAPLLLMCDRHDLGLSIDGLSRRRRVARRRLKPRVASGRSCRRRRRSSSTTTTRAASGSASRSSRMHDQLARAHARADRRMSLRVRLSVVRRARGRDGAAGQGRRARGCCRC